MKFTFPTARRRRRDYAEARAAWEQSIAQRAEIAKLLAETREELFRIRKALEHR